MKDERRPNVYGISRDLWDHPAFAEEAFTEREAWAWLIGAAAWKPIHARGNAGPVHLNRGEFSFSVRFLAEKWKWKKDRVARFMARLKKHDMVRDTERDTCQVYLICNYNKFQIVGVPKRDSERDDERDSTATAPRHARDKEETGETGETGESKTPSRRSDAVDADLFHETTSPKNLKEPITEAFDLYDEFATRNGWSACQNRHDARTGKMAKRLKDAGGIEGFRAALTKAEASDFCCGRAPPRQGQAPFLMHVDFLLQRQSFTRLMEGHYDNRAGAKRQDRLDRIEAGARTAARMPAREHDGSGLSRQAMGSARVVAE